MQSEPHDWTVPAPLRALLWWPPVALVMAMVAPAAAAGTIAIAGGVLAVLGVLVSAVARRIAGDPADLPVVADLVEPGPRLAVATGEAAGAVVMGQQAA